MNKNGEYKALSDKISSYYGINVISIRTNYQSNFVYDYIIHDDCNNLYYLRYLNSKKNILNDICVLQHIHNVLQKRKTFCVPKWILSIDGNSTLNYNDNNYILLSKLSHKKRTSTNWNYNKIFNNLIEMHVALLEVSNKNKDELTFFNIINSKYQNIQGEFGQILKIAIKTIIDYPRFEYLRNYKRQIIHGDFHSSNVFPGENNKTNIIDFFNSTNDTPLFDLLELMDLFPENKFNILDKYNNLNRSVFKMKDFEYLKFVKATFYLNRINENYKLNSRLKGGSETVKRSLVIINNYLYS